MERKLKITSNPPGRPMVTVYCGRVCSVISVINEMDVKQDRNDNEMRTHLVVHDSVGSIYTLVDYDMVRKEYDQVYHDAVDLNEVIEVLAAISRARRQDGKVKIDKSVLIDLKKAGMKFIHQDTGEYMEVGSVFSALQNMAADASRNLLK